MEGMKEYDHDEHIAYEPDEASQGNDMHNYSESDTEDENQEDNQDNQNDQDNENKNALKEGQMEKLLDLAAKYGGLDKLNKDYKMFPMKNNKFGSVTYISTEGITVYSLDEIEKELLKNSDVCSLCQKFYNNDMLIPAEKGTERQCYHCLFSMNYPVGNRKHVDGMMGMTIVDYIFKCKDIHMSDICTMKSDSGGCFLCEYNIGLPITDVKDLDKLYSNVTSQSCDMSGNGNRDDDDEVDKLLAGMKIKKEEVITVDI